VSIGDSPSGCLPARPASNQPEIFAAPCFAATLERSAPPSRAMPASALPPCRAGALRRDAGQWQGVVWPGKCARRWRCRRRCYSAEYFAMAFTPKPIFVCRERAVCSLPPPADACLMCAGEARRYFASVPLQPCHEAPHATPMPAFSQPCRCCHAAIADISDASVAAGPTRRSTDKTPPDAVAAPSRDSVAAPDNSGCRRRCRRQRRCCCLPYAEAPVIAAPDCTVETSPPIPVRQEEAAFSPTPSRWRYFIRRRRPRRPDEDSPRLSPSTPIVTRDSARDMAENFAQHAAAAHDAGAVLTLPSPRRCRRRATLSLPLILIA